MTLMDSTSNNKKSTEDPISEIVSEKNQLSGKQKNICLASMKYSVAKLIQKLSFELDICEYSKKNSFFFLKK